MRCRVLNCNGLTRFKFPKKSEQKQKWLKAIRRPDFIPKPSHGLCEKHFADEDIITERIAAGHEAERFRLKPNSVPKIFSWQVQDDSTTINPSNNDLSSPTIMETEESLDSIDDIDEVYENHSEYHGEVNNVYVNQNTSVCEESNGSGSLTELIDYHVSKRFDLYEENICTEKVEANESKTTINECISKVKKVKNVEREYKSISIGTDRFSRIDIDDFKNRPKELNHFTGFEYEQFMTVYYSLGPIMKQFEDIEESQHMSTKNQLFLVLWKLRRNWCNLELSVHFNLTALCVSEIFERWITQMARVWSLIDLWPSRELINFYVPHTFKKHFPKTRVTLDATEVKIDAPSNSKLKQATFSTYKNANTLKVMIGTTPGGLISYHSSAYGGSTSDRQIIERSNVPEKCDPGDLVMADKGILIQDLLAPYNVTLNTPTLMVGGSLPHKVVMKDRKFSRHRVHIERIISVIKTFTILAKKISRYHLHLANEIIGVCVMLTNFKENIM